MKDERGRPRFVHPSWFIAMLKLLLCLTTAFVTAVAVLQLRQQRLNLNFQTGRLHGEIEKRQAKLWSQQVRIAVATAPNAIAKTVGDQNLDLVPRAPLPMEKGNWMKGKGQ